MTYKDILEETFIALLANKVRSGLTILGIVIGIASVIAMVAIGSGAQVSIENSIQSIGSNLIIIQPGTQKGVGMQVSSGRGNARTLTIDDANAIRDEVVGVKAVSPEVSGRYQVTSKGKNTNTQVVGVRSSYQDVRNVTVESGVFISDQNEKSLSKVAVLGPTVVEDLFGVDAYPVGQTVRINGAEFKVIGVTAAKGGSGFGSQDDMIFIPITSAQRYFLGDSYVTSISAQAENAEDMTTVQNDITSLLLMKHKISNPEDADFSTLNQADIVATASSVTGTLTALLSAVAGISLLVGGIGIMNMMLTTVTERTREIGLRKAIGARAKDITRQFLIEAIVLTSIGGIIGIILGWLISFGFTYFDILQTNVSFSAILLSFGVSALIGIIFGYYPAKRASKMNPIEALRYE